MEIVSPTKVDTKNLLKYPDLDENIEKLELFRRQIGSPIPISDVYCLIGCTARMLSDQDRDYDHSQVMTLSRAVGSFLSRVVTQFNESNEFDVIVEGYFKDNVYAAQDFSTDLSLWIVFDTVSDNGRLRTGFRFSVNGTQMEQGFIKNDEVVYYMDPAKAPYPYENFYDCLFSKENINYLHQGLVPFKEIQKS